MMEQVPHDFTTYLVMWLIFMSTLAVLNYLVFKPTLKILAERDKHTVGLARDARSFNEQSQIKAKEYEALVLEARTKARKERDEILKVAGAHQKQIIAAAREAAEKHLKGVKVEIGTESAQVRLGLRQQAQILAGDIVERLTRKVA